MASASHKTHTKKSDIMTALMHAYIDTQPFLKIRQQAVLAKKKDDGEDKTERGCRLGSRWLHSGPRKEQQCLCIR